MLYVYVYEGGDNYLSNSQVPNTNFHVPITNYRLPVERDADNGEGGDEAEEDGEDSGHCAKETADETWNDEDDQVDDNDEDDDDNDDDDDNNDGSMRQREKKKVFLGELDPTPWPGRIESWKKNKIPFQNGQNIPKCANSWSWTHKSLTGAWDRGTTHLSDAFPLLEYCKGNNLLKSFNLSFWNILKKITSTSY